MAKVFQPKKKIKNQQYDSYWKLTVEYTDIYDRRFNNTLKTIIKFIDDLRKEAELDGIECYHPSSEKDNRKDILVEYARKNGLFISGGSDYHGRIKPDIEIGIGRGNLNITKEAIEAWV